jgi:hypothetical protein
MSRAMAGEKHEGSMLCCFCGKKIERSNPDPCVISVTTANHEGQWWACHGACFKERLAQDPPAFDPIYF